MNHREKLHAARKRAEAHVREVLRNNGIDPSRFALGTVMLALARDVFAAGYDAAEPDVCARCGAEIERGQ